MLQKFLRQVKGFGLVEVLVAMAVFLLFAIGIYSGTQFVFKVVYQSRIRIIETEVLNEQVEMIRNMSFFDVGIIDGSPVGLLDRTVTTTRNGIDFTVTRTIRNIDDEFDGTVGGDPNDTAPADYKLVELEIICANCLQSVPARLSTYVAPKYLEGSEDNGALFIEVFDASADPVVGAEVHVIATSTDPTVDFTDTTDNAGMLRLVDLGVGLNAYHITVSKTGFTTDQTIVPSDTNPNPTKEPVSVEAQNVTQISFSIDEVSTMELSTLNSVCSAVGSVPVNVLGTRLVGTEPNVFLVNENVATAGGGTYVYSNLPWDNYGLRVSNYDLIGTIPGLPVLVTAGATQPVQLIVGSATDHSLLVHVQDSVTWQPLSSATVRVYDGSYDQTKTTGVGFINQTDWSGGGGQLEMVDETGYWSDSGGVEVADPAGDIKLATLGSEYVFSGELESSVFDLGVEANFVNLSWQPLSQPIESGDEPLKIQIATSNTTTPASWDYLGPDGTGATYYDSENLSINSIHDSNQYFRYKVYLSTQSSTSTPVLSDFNVSYTTSCTPPGQAFYGNLENQEYTVEVSRSGYQTKSESITVSGDLIFSVDLVSE